MVKLRVSGFGYRKNNVFLGCILCADDIVLLEASVYYLLGGTSAYGCDNDFPALYVGFQTYTVVIRGMIE